MKMYVIMAEPSDGYYGCPLASDKIFTESQMEKINRIAKARYSKKDYEGTLGDLIMNDPDYAKKLGVWHIFDWFTVYWLEIKFYEEVSENETD